MTGHTTPPSGPLDGSPVDTVPPSVIERLARHLEADDLRQVAAASFEGRSGNAWFHGTAKDREIFVKLYAWADRAEADRAVSAAVGSAHTTRLLGGGRSRELGEYAVFAWEDLTALPWDIRSAAAAGRLLAAVHDTSQPREPDGSPSLRQTSMTAADYLGRLEELHEQAPGLFARLREQLAGARAGTVVTQAERIAAVEPHVLLHGDFTLRNIARSASGRDLVFDFEQAACGPAEGDLHQLWDRELAAIPGGRRAFIAAYRSARIADPGPPRPAVLDYARLSYAVSALTTARRTGSPEFETEGLAILKALT
jgi:hypothetical protein